MLRQTTNLFGIKGTFVKFTEALLNQFTSLSEDTGKVCFYLWKITRIQQDKQAHTKSPNINQMIVAC